jgi:hypothetical protein
VIPVLVKSFDTETSFDSSEAVRRGSIDDAPLTVGAAKIPHRDKACGLRAQKSLAFPFLTLRQPH